MKGKIILVPFPYNDLTITKLRPALVIHEGESDVILAFISSKPPSKLSEADLLLTKEHPSFEKTGLKTDSLIRLDKVVTVLKDLIVGEIGEFDNALKNEINAKPQRLFRL